MKTKFYLRKGTQKQSINFEFRNGVKIGETKKEIHIQVADCSLSAADLKPFEAVKEILIANYSNFSPMIAVDYGRKVMFTDQRPTMTELSEGVMATSGNKLTG